MIVETLSNGHEINCGVQTMSDGQAVKSPFTTTTTKLSPWGLGVLLTGAFVVVFDVFVVNVAIPSLKADLGASFAEAGMVIAIYALAFGASLIVGGRLGDIFGRRRVFSLGMAGFAATSLLCGIAPTPLFLILARILQGISAALLFPQVYTLLRVLHGDEARSRAFGHLGMILGLAAIAGQLLGGLIVWCDLFGFGWRMIFFVNLPIGLAAAVLARMLPESRAPTATGLDLPGAILAVVALALLLVSLLEGSAQGWPIWTFGCILLAMLVGMLFVRREVRVNTIGRTPIIDMALFANRDFTFSVLAILLVYSTPASFFLCFSLTTQTGFGVTPINAGALLTPMSIGFVLASLLAPRLVRRFGPAAIVCGMALYAAGFLWLGCTADDIATGLSDISYLAGMTMFGIGQGLSGPPLLNIAIGRIGAEDAGMASGIISTVQQLGAAFGIALAGIVFADALAGNSAESIADRYTGALAAAMVADVSVITTAAALLLLIAKSSAEATFSRASARDKAGRPPKPMSQRRPLSENR